MPFKRAGKRGGKRMYKSPSGKRYTGKQVRAYYATKGWSRPVRRPGQRKK